MKEIRPWGSYITCLNLGFFKIKKITVNPHSRISLQRHFKRAELWFLTSGAWFAESGSYTFNPNNLIFIKKGCIHRITNFGDKAFSFIEFQFGICREDDIERLFDDYDRLVSTKKEGTTNE